MWACVSATSSRLQRFTRGLGFEDVATVPGPDGFAVMVMLQRGAMSSLTPSKGCRSPRANTKNASSYGPRGLGVAIGLGVDDLDAAYTWCQEHSCEIAC